MLPIKFKNQEVEVVLQSSELTEEQKEEVIFDMLPVEEKLINDIAFAITETARSIVNEETNNNDVV